MANGLTFKFRTPKNSIKSTKSVKEAIIDHLKYRVGKNALERTSRIVTVETERQYTIAATFFQRVCSRTPLDEYYLNLNGKTYHLPDDEQCRMHWSITDGNSILTAKELADEMPEIFDVFNNPKYIEIIKSELKARFKPNKKGNLHFQISNDSPYFATLEYGGYEVDYSAVKQGPLYEHGVKNKRSVQAPMGMLRITQMELADISLEASRSASSYAKFSTSKKIPDEKKVAEFVKKIRGRKGLTLADLKEIVK